MRPPRWLPAALICAAQPPPEPRLAGPKMHKTASTTLGGILARAANKYKWQARLYGTTHPLDPAPRFGSRFKAAEKPCILYAHVYGSANEGNPSDVMLLPSGKKFKMRRLPMYDFAQLQTYYQKAVPGARLVVSLREPLARYISMMNYFAHAERDTKKEIGGDQTRLFFDSLRKHVARGRGGDYQSRVLGLRNATATSSFIKKMDNILLLTTARMDESLIVLRRALGWAPEDILHLDVHVSCADGVRYDGRAVLCVEPLLKELPPDLHEEIVALHRHDLALYQAADDEVADRFRKLGPDGEEERDRLQLRKRQLAFHCQREGPSSTYRPDKAAFDGDPCVPYLINDASFQMYLSRRPPSYVFDGRTFIDKSGTPVKRRKKEWRDVFHLRALQYNVSYGTLPGDLAKRLEKRRSVPTTRGAARAAKRRVQRRPGQGHEM